MAFFLFLLVNATLFLRPAEIVPAWQGASLYEFLILGCALFALPEMLAHLGARPLEAQPVTLGVLGLLAAILLAPLTGLDFDHAWQAGFLFAKVIVYYLLLVSLVNTPARLGWFMVCLVWFSFGLALITVLQYHEVFTLPTLKKLTEMEIDRVTGDALVLTRLQGSGIFHDPNDLGVMLAMVVPLALYCLTNPGGVGRAVYLAPLALFLYAIGLTQSRGAFLALLTGLGATLAMRYGGRKTLAIAALGLPFFVLAFAGRQTTFSATHGTGQSRIQLWSDWLTEFRAQPLFGKGLEIPEENAEFQPGWTGRGHTAHNAYLQAFAELGFLGGLLFLGLFYFALLSLVRMQPCSRHAPRAVTAHGVCLLQNGRLHPFLFGAVAAYALGLMSLSMGYVIPTYLVVGLAVAYARITPCYSPLPAPRFDGTAVRRLFCLSLGFLALMYVTVRVFIRW